MRAGRKKPDGVPITGHQNGNGVPAQSMSDTKGSIPALPQPWRERRRQDTQIGIKDRGGHPVQN